MSKHILIIDDDYVIRNLLNDFFSLKGFTVYEKNNCLSLINNPKELAKYDVLIIDFNMPYINGVEFIKKIRNIIPYTLIIGISSFEDVSKIFLDAGADYFFLKPFSLFDMLNIINNYLSKNLYNYQKTC